MEELQFKLKGSLLAEFLILLGEGVLFLLRPSTDWMRPSHVMDGILLYSQSTDFSVNLILKIPSQKHLE